MADLTSQIGVGSGKNLQRKVKIAHPGSFSSKEKKGFCGFQERDVFLFHTRCSENF